MGRKKGRDRAGRRGKRRSIRYAATGNEDAAGPDAYRLDAPPTIMLRRLAREDALRRLAAQVRAHVRAGADEVLVVHGRGHGSTGGVPVLGPAVREWCDENPGLVAGWREAPARWGGPGAVVIALRPARESGKERG